MTVLDLALHARASPRLAWVSLVVHADRPASPTAYPVCRGSCTPIGPRVHGLSGVSWVMHAINPREPSSARATNRVFVALGEARQDDADVDRKLVGRLAGSDELADPRNGLGALVIG